MPERADALARDGADPLAGFRSRFVVPPEGLVYLDGNSLGMLPRATVERMARVVGEEWGERLIRGWAGDGWLELPGRVGDEIGTAVLGAGPGQVVVGDSTTVCFYKLCAAALDAVEDPRRVEVVTDADNFPTDRYVLEGLCEARGLELRIAGTVAEAVAGIGERTALAAFSHVAYRTAEILPLEEIAAAARAAGARCVWDLSHAAGSVPVALDEWGAELAVGCTYKYLNGGPGAPAWMYVRRELQPVLRQPVWGWLGRRDPFAMGPGYEPAEGITGWLSGTPPVLALSAVREGVALVAEAGMAAVRAKGVALTALCIELSDALLAEHGVTVASPREDAARGAHVALAHPAARELVPALEARGVIADFREPDLIRLGLSPLTTRFADVWDGVEALRALLAVG